MHQAWVHAASSLCLCAMETPDFVHMCFRLVSCKTGLRTYLRGRFNNVYGRLILQGHFLLNNKHAMIHGYCCDGTEIGAAEAIHISSSVTYPWRCRIRRRKNWLTLGSIQEMRALSPTLGWKATFQAFGVPRWLLFWHCSCLSSEPSSTEWLYSKHP